MSARVLIAGIGNVLFGDDGFGCEAARACRDRAPEGVDVIDFGVRGFDLACAIVGGAEAVILLDAMPRGGAPGTIYVLEPEVNEASLDGHALHGAAALALARSLGPLPYVRVVGCEPAPIDEPCDRLSAAVLAAVPRAAELALTLAREAARA